MVRRVFGYYDLGGPRIPPRLRDIALIDRADGTVWALQNDGVDRIKIVNPLPAGFKGDTFAAFDGPRIDTVLGSAELLVRDGHLGYELKDFRGSDRPMFAPNVTQAKPTDTIFEIRAPVIFNEGGALAYETEPL